jgi:outer membrane receptor protein involved in Fe transport
MNIITSALKRRLLPVSAVFLAACTVGFSQTTSEVTASDKAKDAEVLKLNPFTVSGQKEVGYGTSRTMSGNRTNKSLLELPTAIGLISKEVIEDLAALDVHEILRFGVSGVTQNQTIGDDVNIRGFRTNGSLRNGIPAKSGPHVNTLYDIERAEVIKGPASMVLGGASTAVGGAVNYVTIKPTAVQSNTVGLTISDLGLTRIAINNMGPLYTSGDLKALYRVTLGALSADRDKEIENEEEKFAGGALALYFGANTSVDLTAFVVQNNGYKYWNDFLDVSNNGVINNWTPSVTALGIAKLNQYSTKSASPFRRKNAGFADTSAMVELTFLTKLTDNSNIRLYANQNNIVSKDQYSRGITMQQNNYMMNRQDIPQNDNYKTWYYQIDYIHKLQLAHLTIDSMVGVDAGFNKNFSELSVNDVTNGGPAALDMRAPDYSADDAYFAKLMPGRGLPHLSSSQSRSQTVTRYFQENISLFKDRVLLIGGLRWFSPSSTSTNNVTKVTTTGTEIETKVHKYGIVVKLRPWLSAYYTDAQNIQLAAAGRTDKYKANDQLGDLFSNQAGINKEFGLKADYRVSDNVKIYGSVAQFTMSLTNVRTFGDLGNGVEGIIQSAKDNSTGWESDIGVSAKLGAGRVDVIATYFDGDSYIAANRAVQAQGFVGRKDSIMAKYTFLSSGALNGAMLGAAYETQTGKRNGNFYMPAYDFCNIFARYNLSKKLSLQVNLNNLGNERIIIAQAASALVQTLDPMRTRITLTYKF